MATEADHLEAIRRVMDETTRRNRAAVREQDQRILTVLAEAHWALRPECITFKGHIRLSGYGQAYRPNGRGPVSAHVLVWEQEYGRRVPVRHELHHRCLNRSCVNVDHLELLTIAEHKERHRALRPRCGNGHEFSPENTYIRPKDGARLCRRCRADAQQRHRDRAKQQAVTA